MGRHRNADEPNRLKVCEECGKVIPKIRLKSWSSYNKLHCCSFECKLERMRRLYGKPKNEPTGCILGQALNGWRT